MAIRRFGGLLIAVLCAAGLGQAMAQQGQDQQSLQGQSQQSLQNVYNSLPSTNMSEGGSPGPVEEHRPAPAKGFAHAVVADNPLAPDAHPVGERVCIACHRLEAEHFTHTLHSLGLHVANRADPSIPVCETCHGPGSRHAANPTSPGLILAYTRSGGTPVDVQTGVCLSCHKGGPRDHWLGSVHQRNGLSCSDCHNPMSKFSVAGSMAKMSISDTCAQCHKDIRLQFNRRSHMPLPEGQMSCDDCHNPHGSITDPLLKTNTVNETCWQCHAEKRGPFLFEHPPVRESCLNCHTPHGSNQATLLVAPIPMLCQQCHTDSAHSASLLTPQNTKLGPHPVEQLMGRGCITCHAQIHGSNAPSGPRFHE